MEKTHCYYIECTFDENGKTWQRWSIERFMSFSRVKDEMWKISRQELEFNTKEAEDPSILKIQGFRIIQETTEINTTVISECLLV